MNPYDGDAVAVGWLHSLSIIHGANLIGTRDANVNIIKVTRNVTLAYEDEMDGERGNLHMMATKVFVKNDIVDQCLIVFYLLEIWDHCLYCNHLKVLFKYFDSQGIFERVGNS